MLNENKQIQVFVPGSEWLFYKIYCGYNISDFILINILKPLIKTLEVKKLIDQWFFIRYSDPHQHLRIRFHLINLSSISEIMSIINSFLLNYIKNKLIWNIQIDTYTRELERYGENNINEAELFFQYDSFQILYLLEKYKDEESRFLALFKWIEFIISLFKIENKNLIFFLDNMQKQFKEEYRVGKNTKKELSFKYKDFLALLSKEQDLTVQNENKLRLLAQKILILNQESQLEIFLEKLVSSFIHMSINRFFNSNQRLYEMVLYDYLYKKNKSNFIRYGKI